MSHIVEKKAENYKKLLMVTFYQNIRKSNILEMLRFFFRSVYKKILKHIQEISQSKIAALL